MMMKIDCGNYPLTNGFDELLEAPGKPRSVAEGLCNYFAELPSDELEARHRAVDAAIMAAGITFTVYSEAGNIDRASSKKPNGTASRPGSSSA
jgi:uncharacterized circularly permuted ATP-grasp superfamily protein